ncbi:MAG: PAS domain S-box protein [Breznakibacter sp.]
MTVIEESNCSSLFFNVFDLVTDAVLIYSQSGLHRHNKAAQKLFARQTGFLQTNIPAALCNGFAHLPRNDMQAQWACLQRNAILPENYLFDFDTQSHFEARMSIDHINAGGQLFCIFVISNVRPTDLPGTVDKMTEDNGPNIDPNRLKSIKKSLHGIESPYQTMTELPGSLIYEFVIARNEINWQGPIEEMTGYPREEFNSYDHERHIQLIHPGDRDAVVAAFKRAIQTRVPIKNRFRYLKRNGDYIEVEETSYVFCDEQGEPVKIIGCKRDITTRKQAEDRIKESEFWYRKLFETANDAIFVIENKYVVDCNSKAISVFGRKKTELVGKYALTYSCETQADGMSNYDRILQILDRVETGESCFYEWQFYRPDNTVFDTEVSLSMLEMPSKKIILAIVRDVSVRKSMEKDLQSSEARYRNLFDTMFNGLIVMSPVFDATGKMVNARYLDVNPFYIKLVNKPYEKIIGRTISDITGSNPVWLNQYETAFNTGSSVSFQDYHPTFHKHLRIKVFKPSDDCFAVMFDDISQHVLAENIIHDNQKKYQMLFDNMHSACTINLPYFDDCGKMVDCEYVEVNNAFETQSGIPAERVRGKRISQLLDDFDRSWLDIYEKVFTTGKPVTIEKYSIEMKRHFKVNVFKQSEHYFATLFDDITELKNTEQQIIDTIVEVEERERRQLACDLHDDIGPQLVSMRMYLITLQRMGLTDRQQELYQTVIDLLDQTIASVRAISANLSPALLQKFGLAAAINAECDHARVLFSVDFKNNIQQLRFHQKIEAMIYRIVKELLNNTKKYAGATNVILNLDYSNDSLSLIYIDNGKGFDYKSIINAPNTGMGLTNIDMRVKSLNGKSGFSDNPFGKGLLFELLIPVAFDQVKYEHIS